MVSKDYLEHSRIPKCVGLDFLELIVAHQKVDWGPDAGHDLGS